MFNDSQANPGSSESQTWQTIRRVVAAARDQLEMDLVFLGEFTDTSEVFRAVSGDGESFGMTEGGSLPLAETYCQALVDGRIDNVIRDTSAEPLTAALAVTASSDIGCYVGVPVRLTDGRLYGVLCGLGHEPDTGLRSQDARFLGVLATIIEGELARDHDERARRAALIDRVEPVLNGDGLSMVFQPVVDLRSGTTCGFEALARFSGEPYRPPDAWFADAAEVGLGLELEMTAVLAALGAIDRMPHGAFIGVNVSPATVCSSRLAEVLQDLDASRIVLEITEHAVVADYQPLTAALSGLRASGVRLAVDDAGAGVASLHHILALAPELIKMDISLTRGIDADRARAALATALVSFADATEAQILAEGIETPGELDAVRHLGVTYGQGYLLGRPAPLAAGQSTSSGRSDRDTSLRAGAPLASRRVR
ncbi:MAG: sensor domain-containing phosphodiesterase [Acidimicrobiales bacterium]